MVLAALVAGALLGAANVMVTQSRAAWPTVLQMEQRITADFVGARSGQLVAMCCGLPQVKHTCFCLTASAESHVAVSSLSGMLQDMDGSNAILRRNCASYCSQAYTS